MTRLLSVFEHLLVAFAVAFLVAQGSLSGQATSQIRGTITDPTGKPIAEATVKATQKETGIPRTVLSGQDGTYVFSSLPIGLYEIAVTKADFKRRVKTDIALQVASGLTEDVGLEVGSVSDTISVIADALQVDTLTPSIGTVVDSQRILDLPLNGRNAMELVQLAGAAAPAGKNTTNGFPGGLNISIAGGQLSGIGYLLDGVMYSNLLDAVSLPFPFPDALQEFKVETSTMPAQNARAAATVSASIRSGANQFHGGVFEFFRNGSMNARNTFAPRRDTLKRNQFGGTFGGPIVKNKLFFFAGYQGTLTRSDPDDRPAFVPTPQMLSGDFSGCPGFSAIRDPTTNPPTTFPGSQIPVSRFSQQALNVVKFLPTSSDPCGKVSFGAITKSNEHQVLGRLDYAINSRHQLFGRYMATAYAQPSPYGLSGNALDTAFAGVDDLAQSAALGHTYVASPNVVNQFRFGMNRVAVRRFGDDYFSGCTIGVSMYCYPAVDKKMILVVSGGFNIGATPSTPGYFFPTYLTLSDDVSVVRGSHTFSFGYSSFKFQLSQEVNIASVGNFGFPGTVTGQGITDFLLGRVSTLTQAAPSTVFTNKWGHSLYAQDIWKVSRRLTLNYGLRWEPFLPQALNDGAVYNFSMDAFRAGTRTQVYPNAPPGLSYPGDPGFHGKTGVNKRWNQFAPRVGIAFDPRGDGRTSIRASGGVAYDFPNLQIMSNPTAASPFAHRVLVQGPVGFDKPYGDNIPFPAAPGTFTEFGTFVAQQPDAKAPTTYTWNLSIQQQLGKDLLISASYMGSQSIHAWVSRALNPAILVPGPVEGPCARTATNCNGTLNTNRRRLAYLINPDEGSKLGAVDMFESGGGSNYNGLILSAQKRVSRGVSFSANYTWSHCIGDLTISSGPGGVAAGGGTYTDLNDRRRDRGNCTTSTIDGSQATDRRHIANFTTVLEAPKFQGQTLSQLASHWRLAASYRFLSASYLTVTNGADVALSGVATTDQRANQLTDDVHCKPRNADCWISPVAFGRPAFGTLGNAGRANVAGPGFFGLDMAVSRIFRVSESMNLEARGEAFNLTNSVRLNAPNTALSSNSNFGKVQTAQDPRILQLALKLVF